MGYIHKIIYPILETLLLTVGNIEYGSNENKSTKYQNIIRYIMPVQPY